MRRIFVIVLFLGAFQVMAATPAFAIWGLLEKLSGPGKFDGLQLEFRLVCFGQKDAPAASVPLPGIESGCPVTKDVNPKTNGKNSGTSDKKPWGSINLGVRFFRAGGEPQFAANKEITLTTVVPSFSWSVFAAEPKADVLEVGVGGGIYWFSSEGFESFRGVILEPLRFDVHVARGWVKNQQNQQHEPLWWALAQAVTFRIGWVVFPSGFDANAFNGTGPGARRIPAESVLATGVFLNLEPLVRRANGL